MTEAQKFRNLLVKETCNSVCTESKTTIITTRFSIENTNLSHLFGPELGILQNVNWNTIKEFSFVENSAKIVFTEEVCG
jgi:hypothetical protein